MGQRIFLFAAQPEASPYLNEKHIFVGRAKPPAEPCTSLELDLQ